MNVLDVGGIPIKDRVLWTFPIDDSYCTCGNKISNLPGRSCTNLLSHIIVTAGEEE